MNWPRSNSSRTNGVASTMIPRLMGTEMNNTRRRVSEKRSRSSSRRPSAPASASVGNSAVPAAIASAKGAISKTQATFSAERAPTNARNDARTTFTN